MKVLLVDPPSVFLEADGRASQLQPLGIASVGAVLSAEHDVRFLLPDTRSYTGEDPWAEIRGAIIAEAPDVIGITAVTAKYPMAVEIARIAKSVDLEIVTVLGGVHATSCYGQVLEQRHFDFVIRGEGEYTLLELVRTLEAQKTELFCEIPGLCFNGAAGPVVNVPRVPVADLDGLPFAKRDDLVWDEDILPPFYQSIITVRGCPYQCIYCAVPASNERKTRYRSAANVLEEIQQLSDRHDIPELFFHDSVFTMHRERTIELCDGMRKRGLDLPFYCQTRADRVDCELLDRMAAAGCHQIFLGIESGEASSLARMKKKMTLEVIRDAVDRIKSKGIRCTGFFMIGFPWETEDGMRATIDFACDLDLDGISLFSATPLPGTELWELSGGDHLPVSIDFTTPQVNLTSMDEDEYREVFRRSKAQVDAYNFSVMEGEYRATVGQDVARPLNWVDR